MAGPDNDYIQYSYNCIHGKVCINYMLMPNCYFYACFILILFFYFIFFIIIIIIIFIYFYFFKIREIINILMSQNLKLDNKVKCYFLFPKTTMNAVYMLRCVWVRWKSVYFILLIYQLIFTNYSVTHIENVSKYIWENMCNILHGIHPKVLVAIFVCMHFNYIYIYIYIYLFFIYLFFG